MRSFLALMVALFCVALAVVIGSRLSTEAVAVVVGVVCGVIASIPISLIVAFAASRRPHVGPVARDDRPVAYGSAGYSPPVVIVGPGANGRMPMLPYLPPIAPPLAPRREFTIIGDEAE